MLQRLPFAQPLFESLKIDGGTELGSETSCSVNAIHNNGQDRLPVRGEDATRGIGRVAEKGDDENLIGIGGRKLEAEILGIPEQLRPLAAPALIVAVLHSCVPWMWMTKYVHRIEGLNVPLVRDAIPVRPLRRINCHRENRDGAGWGGEFKRFRHVTWHARRIDEPRRIHDVSSALMDRRAGGEINELKPGWKY